MVSNKQFNQNLRLISLGGVDNVTKNMFIYEFGNDILLVDCGIGFPDEPDPNQELLLPDLSYLLANRHKIRGLVITHAHFDHYGAVCYLLSHINIPIYTSRLTQEFIKLKAQEAGLKISAIDFHLISSADQMIKIGCFQVIPFHINHSVPESLGLFLRTPRGNVFHVADYKFDWTPVAEEPFDIQKVSALASQKKPLLLLSDCLGATKPGHTKSEKSIQENFERLIGKAEGLVLVTTVSSNISRIWQAVAASVRIGRKVAFLGRSMEQNMEVAKKLGYFKEMNNYLLPLKKIRSYPGRKLTLITAGCYGQSDSALEKLSQNKHHLLRLKERDTIIFSADPSPPGVVVKVNQMIDNFSRLGVQVFYYEIQENLYVSGHGTAEDIKMLLAIVKPTYLLPIGGDFRHMRSYQMLAQQMGYNPSKTILLKEKQIIEFTPQGQLVVK